MKEQHLVVSDCNHVDFAEERNIAAANGLTFLNLQLLGKSDDEAAEALHPYTCIGNQRMYIGPSLMDRLPNLRCIVRYGVGVDNIDVPAATQRGIAVCNVPDYGTQEVASQAFAMFMALTRKLKLIDRSLASGSWNYKRSIPIKRYTEMTVGIIGYGRIGRMFAGMVRALGCKIVVNDILYPANMGRKERRANGIEDDVTLMDLNDLLACCDAVSLHCPLTDETRHLIGRETITQMRDGAFLMNCARGGVVCEADLYEALVSGKLAGAGVDTWEQEPTAASNPLLQLDNFLASPHMAWYSEEASSDLKRKLAEEVVRAMNNEPLHYQLNR